MAYREWSIFAPMHPQIRTVNVTRYITPLREGGSLPAVAEADDSFKYVIKFRGAGHGVKALISEFIGTEVSRAAGMKVPELVFANLDAAFGRTEGDEEIQDLLRASHGLNLGLHFLSGAINFDPVVTHVDTDLASQIVWIDAFLTNIDRTFRNTNMLMWHKELWLIDHGASLYFHHSWGDWEKAAKSTFEYAKDHVLLPRTTPESLHNVNTYLKKLITPATLAAIVSTLPVEWLQWSGSGLTPTQIREVYAGFLTVRLENSDLFLNEAKDAAASI